MFKLKKVVDERQELELLRIEHLCFWFLFWALTISIVGQSILMNAPLKQFAPEFIIFMSVCILFLVLCIRKGLWDYYSKPTTKTYFITSLIGSISFGTIVGISKYNAYEQVRNHIFTMFLPIILITTLSMFVLIFFTSYVLGKLVIKKQNELEEDFSDDN